MPNLSSVFASLASWAVLIGSVQAQVPFPPPTLLNAPSIEAAAAALGAGKPEFSGYLLLDIPEIMTAGKVDAVVRSEIPGTGQLVLIRQFPVSSSAAKAATAGSRVAPTVAKAKPGQPASPRSPPTVFVAAKRVEPGEPAEMKARFDFDRNERFTVLAFAQGRWFAAAREIKLAREPSDRP